jgi:hypothetical protein
VARQAVVRIALALALVGVVALGAILAFSDPAKPLQQSCIRSTTYGTQCVTLSGKGLTVLTIGAQFSTTPDFYTHLRWTFETTTYRCDPRGKPKSRCAPEATIYGTLHRPNPANTAETACSTAGATPVRGCTGNLRFAVPHPFADARWLCEEVAVQVQGKWVDNGAGLPAGDRACRRVH